MSSASSYVVVIGFGNSWSGDDAAGVLAARRLRGRLPKRARLIEHEGEPTALIDLWDGAELAIVVDAISGGGQIGDVQFFDATSTEVPSSFTGSSTHAFSLAQAIELARALGRLPARLLVVGIEGGSFEAGAEPQPDVVAAADAAAVAVLERLAEHLEAAEEAQQDA